MAIDQFKADLRELTSIELVRKYLYSGSGGMLTDDQHYQLKNEISLHLGVHFNDIVLVGSSKLGFSIKPTKRYFPFGEESDIDVAVVSTNLFQKVWQESYLYRKGGADWPAASEFFKYLSKGWIRPDKLPAGGIFEFSASWWDFFNELTASRRFGPYKIRAGLYQSLFFLEEYQKICIEQCIEESR